MTGGVPAEAGVAAPEGAPATRTGGVAEYRWEGVAALDPRGDSLASGVAEGRPAAGPATALTAGQATAAEAIATGRRERQEKSSPPS